jgi:hypothetical protein
MKQDADVWKNCVGRYLRLPTFGKDSYFWGGLLVVLSPVLLALVFLVLGFVGFVGFLVFFGAAVLFWSVAGWLWVAGAVACAKVSGRLAAAKTIASMLFFMWVSPCGIHLSRQFHLAATPD